MAGICHVAFTTKFRMNSLINSLALVIVLFLDKLMKLREPFRR